MKPMYYPLLALATAAASFAFPPPSAILPQVIRHDRVHKPALQAYHVYEEPEDTPLPVILWHGLGDSSTAEGLKDMADLLDEVNPGTYVHIVSADPNGGDDRSASFFGNVTEQIQLVCETLINDPIISTAPAVDAIGFSQGGQFLRGAIERCGGLPGFPRVRTLMTFGSQHNGIAEFQKCKGFTDFICNAANALLKSRTVWSDYVQSRLVPAQYYRAPDDYENYLNHSNFLADINNERDSKNETYKKNLASLEHFIMLLFGGDLTVIPKESGWFAEVNATSGAVTNLTDRAIYKEDWIGLKKLDQKGALVFETLEGEHMNLREKDLKKLFKKYLGPESESSENVIQHADL